MIIAQQNKYSGYFNIDEITIEKDGKFTKQEILVKDDGVGAIVYNKKTDKYIFVSQWRATLDDDMVEIVAGAMDIEGEDAETAIKREVLEEIGYKCDKVELIEEGFASPGGITEYVKIFYIEVSEKVSNGGGNKDENENIEIVEKSYEEMVNSKFYDMKTSLAVNWVKLKKANLKIEHPSQA